MPRALLMRLPLPIIRLLSCAHRTRRRRSVCSSEDYCYRTIYSTPRKCPGCTHRSISSTAWCRICRRLPAAVSTGARWTGTRRRSCWKANRRVRFCCATRPRRSSCFPSHSESTTVPCMLASSSLTISLVSTHAILASTRPRR